MGKNAFDTAAKSAPAVKSAKSSKAMAEVTPEIAAKVDEYVQTKAQIKAAEAQLGELETAIIEHVRPQQD